ncbi:MAG: DUF2236 domain-containing protein [Spirochaetota bacterium]|nr:DUF2236 domain-containing protein [Spirochaetota bacterium]
MSEDNVYFGKPITREIWGNMANIILIYAGSAADFALHPENHWLFYTNKLPSNPQERFIETFLYNQKLFFTPVSQLPRVVSHIRQIHSAIETKRARESSHKMISHTAFKDVFSMLVDYGIRGYEYLNRRKLDPAEKTEYINDIKAVSDMMGISGFPSDDDSFREYRVDCIQNRLQANEYTERLYEAYLNDLGETRFNIVRRFQAQFIPQRLSEELGLVKSNAFSLLYRTYPYVHHGFLLRLLMRVLLKKAARQALYKISQVSFS